jgi:hypothetical protein
VLPTLTPRILLNNNSGVPVEFSQSARRHKIGRARVRQVLADPVVVVRIEEPHDPRVRMLYLGDDESGGALEVVAVEEGDWWSSFIRWICGRSSACFTRRARGHERSGTEE